MLINKEKQNIKRATKNVFLKEPLVGSSSKKENKKLKNAILKNNIMLVKEMIQQGADINQKIIEKVEVPKMGVKADLESRLFWIPCTETTPLILAVWLEHYKLVDLLVEAGAELDKKDSNGYTALMRAAFIGDLGICKKLVSAGADIEMRNQRGKTALMFASYNYNLKIVKYLLSIGANPLKKDISEKSAYEHATMKYESIKAIRLMRIFRDTGAMKNSKNKTASKKLNAIPPFALLISNHDQNVEKDIQDIIGVYIEKWKSAGKWMATEKLMKALRKCNPENVYSVIRNL